MRLRYITCSDPREHNSVESIMKLAKNPKVEIAVQCHPSKMSAGMPRNIWFEKLLLAASSTNDRINLAIHINAEWAYDICVNGKIPDLITEWLLLEKALYVPLIQRFQLNMSKQTADNMDANALAKIIHDFPCQEVILQYNDKTKGAAEKLHKTGAHFSMLYDASGGNGVAPQVLEKPVYNEHQIGYSGGISPENVMKNLDKISAVLPADYQTWIDAEWKLKTPTLFDEKPLFDVERAQEYIRRANLWQKIH